MFNFPFFFSFQYTFLSSIYNLKPLMTPSMILLFSSDLLWVQLCHFTFCGFKGQESQLNHSKWTLRSKWQIEHFTLSCTIKLCFFSLCLCNVSIREITWVVWTHHLDIIWIYVDFCETIPSRVNHSHKTDAAWYLSTTGWDRFLMCL